MMKRKLMIVGTGLDIVNVARIKASLKRHGDRFLTKIFTTEEIAYCRNRARRHEHLATRFAAKEAVLKALGTGMSLGASLHDVEVRNNAEGKPEVVLYGPARRLARRCGIARLHLSLSHTDELAVAQVVAEGFPAPRLKRVRKS